MRHILTALFLSVTASAFGQASVAYYPLNPTFLSVSTNPDRAVWLDARLQTNTALGALGTTICPMVNVVRKPTINYYVGAGISLNPLTGLNDERFVRGYSAHVGIRFIPLSFLPRFRVAFELSPFTQSNFKYGNLFSNLGLVYQFQKKRE